MTGIDARRMDVEHAGDVVVWKEDGIVAGGMDRTFWMDDEDCGGCVGLGAFVDDCSVEASTVEDIFSLKCNTRYDTIARSFEDITEGWNLL